MTVKTTHRYAVLFVVSLVLVFGAMGVGYADEPEQYEMASVRAPQVMFSVYEVIPGKEVEFLDLMVKTGPYNIMSSVVANEKILQPLPASGKTIFFSVSRHYDRATTETIQRDRVAALRPLLVRDPVEMHATLVEHLLADWGWERGTQSSFLRVSEKDWGKGVQSSSTNVRSASTDDIFKKFLSSLAFFKSGYCGQVGMLEFYPAGTSVEQIRSEVGSRNGFSGASIFSLGKKKGFAVYGEFFKGPAGAEKQSLVSQAKAKGSAIFGSQAGMVVQNYRPR